MSVYRVSYRYANSLMQLAVEKNIYDKVAKDAELIYNALDSSRELRVVLKSPVIKSTEKTKLISAIFAKNVSPETEKFLEFVIEKGREDILFEIFKEFMNLRDKREGIIRTKVVSAVDLNDEIKNKITSQLEQKTAKKVVSSYVVNEKIIGGFIAEVGDTVFDSSVRHQLQLLRKKFSEEISISNN